MVPASILERAESLTVWPGSLASQPTNGSSKQQVPQFLLEDKILRAFRYARCPIPIRFGFQVQNDGAVRILSLLTIRNSNTISPAREFLTGLEVRMRHFRLRGLCLLMAILMVGSCKQSPAARDALAELQKINSATQLGTTYVQYLPLLASAKAKVNQADSSLPNGELKFNLDNAMDAYTDAAKIWSWEVNHGELNSFGYVLFARSDEGKLARSKYGALSSDDLPHDKRPAVFGGPTMDPDIALRQVWKVASDDVNEAARILN